MEEQIELDIIVKILDLKYAIEYNNNSLINNNISIENSNTDWNKQTCFLFLQFDTKNTNIITNIIVTLYPININKEDYIIGNNTYNFKFTTDNIIKIMNKYIENDYFILFRNTNKYMEILNSKYNSMYTTFMQYINNRKRLIFCLDSILKTIVKIPVIVQGRQVLRKYRVPPNQLVFDKLNIKNNICHLSNLEGDRILLFSIIKQIIDLIFNHIYIKDSSKQTDIFLYLSNLNLNITSKNIYNGKTISAIFRVISLIYSGHNNDNIYYIVSNQVKKKNLESFWLNYIEPYLGYVIKIYTLDNFIKHKDCTIEHLIIDINYYNNQENINILENLVQTNNIKITYVGNIHYSQYFSLIINDVICIDDLEFEKKEIIYKKYIDIDKYFNNTNCIFILDNRVPIEIKNNIRDNVSRENIYNPKKITHEILDGMEFASSYIIYNKVSEIKLSQNILDDIVKRSSKECIFFLEDDIE